MEFANSAAASALFGGTMGKFLDLHYLYVAEALEVQMHINYYCYCNVIYYYGFIYF